MPGPKSRKDLYQVIGVSRDATADEIKQAYRKLARRWHPDVSEEADAEERFKELSEANAVLSDPARRANYDEFGDWALEPGFDAEKARAARSFGGGGPAGFSFQADSAGGLEDLLGGLFGGLGADPGQRHGPIRGADLESALSLDFEQAVHGGVFQLSLPAVDGTPRNVQVRIPAGVNDGGQIRLRGHGGPAPAGGTPGDLLVRVRVRPHRHFRREGRDLHLEVPISVVEATLGADIEVPTLDGRAKVRVPKATDGGSRLRLRGKGIPGAGDAPAGDLYVKVRICVPRVDDDEEREEIEKLSRFGPHDLRADLLG